MGPPGLAYLKQMTKSRSVYPFLATMTASNMHLASMASAKSTASPVADPCKLSKAALIASLHKENVALNRPREAA